MSMSIFKIKSKLVVFVSMLSIPLLVNCTEVKDVYSEYRNKNLDLIVPKVCKAQVELELIRLKKTEKLDYEYKKFIGENKVYKDIDGYVSLKISNRHRMHDLHNLIIPLTKNCYAFTELFYPNNNQGWNDFRAEIAYINSKGITLHRTFITKEKLSIYVNNREYEAMQ